MEESIILYKYLEVPADEPKSHHRNQIIVFVLQKHGN